jgi:hypothetical protein
MYAILLSLCFIAFSVFAGVDKSPLASLDANQFESHLGTLSGHIPFKGQNIQDRFSLTGLTLAREYIKSVLQTAGFAKINKEHFRIRKPSQRRYANGINYYVEIPGRSRPQGIIVIGAHYDSAGMGVPGANDNASGASAVLSVAQAFITQGLQPERTIRFILFDGEELGYRGSMHHFHNSAALNEDIQLFINLDMIAYPLTKHDSFFYDARQYKDALQDLMATATATLPAGETIHPEPAPRIYRSDHNAGSVTGFPSLGIAEHVRTSQGRTLKISPGYHTPNDVIAPLDLSYAFRITKFLAALTWTAANSDENWSLENDAQLRLAACERLLGPLN